MLANPSIFTSRRIDQLEQKIENQAHHPLIFLWKIKLKVLKFFIGQHGDYSSTEPKKSNMPLFIRELPSEYKRPKRRKTSEEIQKLLKSIEENGKPGW